MRHLTYGNTPNYLIFETEYAEQLGPDHIYTIRNDPYFGSGDLSCSELYEQLERACDDWEYNACEAAADFASSVLSTLGFDWT